MFIFNEFYFTICTCLVINERNKTDLWCLHMLMQISLSLGEFLNRYMVSLFLQSDLEFSQAHYGLYRPIQTQMFCFLIIVRINASKCQLLFNYHNCYLVFAF